MLVGIHQPNSDMVLRVQLQLNWHLMAYVAQVDRAFHALSPHLKKLLLFNFNKRVQDPDVGGYKLLEISSHRKNNKLVTNRQKPDGKPNPYILSGNACVALLRCATYMATPT